MLFLNRNDYFVTCWFLKVRLRLVRAGRALSGAVRGLWRAALPRHGLAAASRRHSDRGHEPGGARGPGGGSPAPRPRRAGSRARVGPRTGPSRYGARVGCLGDGPWLAREPGSASRCRRLCRGRGERAGSRSRRSGAVRGEG